MNSKVYKSCAVPLCRNTSVKTPNKLFVHTPNKKIVRYKWLKLARRNPTDVGLKSPIYFCEDHFDLPNDMENYMRYHLMGSVAQVRMKPGCMPKKFDCLTNSNTLTSDKVPCKKRKKRNKRKKMAPEECGKQLEECSKVVEHFEEFRSTGPPTLHIVDIKCEPLDDNEVEIKCEPLDEDSCWVEEETERGLDVDESETDKEESPMDKKSIVKFEMEPATDLGLELRIKTESTIDTGLNKPTNLIEPMMDTELKKEVEQIELNIKMEPIEPMEQIAFELNEPCLNKESYQPVDAAPEINIAANVLEKPRLSVELEIEDCLDVKIEPIVDVKWEDGTADDIRVKKDFNCKRTMPENSTKESSETVPTLVVCPVCGVRYSYIGTLRKHLKQCHDMISCDMPEKIQKIIVTESKISVICECGKVLRRGYLKQHQSKHCKKTHSLTYSVDRSIEKIDHYRSMLKKSI